MLCPIRQRNGIKSVSYTHLDVYKRQLPGCVEDIGNGLCRIYLNGAWSREVLRLLGRVFCATAREHKGETACFAAALDGLAHWADAVLPPRDADVYKRQA